MIIENGYIQFYSGAEPTVGTNGLPVAGEGAWGEMKPCQWRVVSKNLQARSVVSGEATVTSSYEVLLDDAHSWGERAKLYDSDSTLIGEYAVIQDEHLYLLNIRRLYL